MTEQVITNLVTAVAAIIGAAVGFLGAIISANRSIEANRKQTNFQIKKDDLETRVRNLSSLKRACNSYRRVSFISGDTKIISPQLRELVIGICDVLEETPWVFSDSIREVEAELERDLCQVEATFNDEVRPLLGQNTSKICEDARKAARTLEQNVKNMRSLASKELATLLERRAILVQQGIPK